MNFEDSAEEAAFRADVRSWLGANANRRSASVGRRNDEIGTATALARARSWQRKKAEAGFSGITWPKEFGGLAGTASQALIYEEEESQFDIPDDFFSIGLGICLPAVIAHGSDEQRLRYVRPALHGDEIWCQLFSEPAAGSDLAGIRTRAVPNTDSWIVNGQKVWTSGAIHSDFGLLLARSNPDVPKHRGLTMFVVDMRSPGIDVRPLRQATGDAEFSEVFLSNVRIPDAQRVGLAGQGWTVAITALMHERLSVARTLPVATHMTALRFAMTARLGAHPAIADARVRERIVDWYIKEEGLRLDRLRAITALSRGHSPGPEQSVAKLVAARQGQEIATFVLDLLQGDGVVVQPLATDATADVQRQWMWGAAMRIAGGTDEILRNIIAERVLGLPPEPRLDKDVAFNEIGTRNAGDRSVIA